jgi:hypothetical protein
MCEACNLGLGKKSVSPQTLAILLLVDPQDADAIDPPVVRFTKDLDVSEPSLS